MRRLAALALILLLSGAAPVFARGGGGHGGGGHGGGGHGFGGGHSFGGGGSFFGRGYRSHSYGGYHSHGSYYSGCQNIADPADRDACYRSNRANSRWVVIWIVFFAILIWARVRRNSGGAAGPIGEPEYLIPLSRLEPKARATEDQLVALGEPGVAPDRLRSVAQKAFLTLQDSWTRRDYRDMRPLAFADLAEDHQKQIDSMIRNHEINRMADLSIDWIRVVNAQLPRSGNGARQFTVLIQARARDYTVDDRDSTILRGDSRVEPFQEFWTFQQHAGAWLLREIEQIAASGALYEPNAIEGVLAPSAPPPPAPGPVARQVRALAQTDPIWDETKLRETARSAALDLFIVMEKLDLAPLRGRATQKILQQLENDIVKARSAGRTFEYRNLCVRKTELKLARPASRFHPPEFVAWVPMHAQRRILEKGRVVVDDADVVRFDLRLLFVLEGGRFLLGDIRKREA